MKNDKTHDLDKQIKRIVEELPISDADKFGVGIDIKSLIEKERDRIVNDAKEEIEEFEEIAAQPDNDVYIEGWKQCVKFLENKQQTN